MSIRMRLVLSYAAMLLVPILLAAAAVQLFFLLDGSPSDPVKQRFEQEAPIYAELKRMITRDPEALLQRTVAADFDKRLNELNMRLIVRVDRDIVYASPQLDPADWLGALPEYGSALSQPDMHGRLWVTRHDDFLLPDNRQGSLLIVTDTSQVYKGLYRFVIGLVIVVLAILLLTNGVLTYVVSRSIIRPLKSLHRATEEIKMGNLDYPVIASTKDEIGQLSAAFEEMRIKLKESIGLQLQYEENRKELISNISHDLKTPITAIKGYVEGILDGVTNSPDKQERYLKTIHTKALDIDRMIDELFLFSKLDLGKVAFHYEKVELGAYVQDCVQELEFDMEKKGIRLRLEPPTEPEVPLYVKADREKLKRVLLNLVGNAAKYMDKADGHIGVYVKVTSEGPVIGISDNGPGIAPEALPHIFDRFYRADPSRSQAAGGSGLGLAISRQIVEEHGGRMWAESELGKGTTVSLFLPVWKQREGEGQRE